MLLYETGDILKGYPIFCQQVNCKKVMGAGLALKIRNTYPEVYYAYRFHIPELGTILPVKTSDKKVCVNFYSQFDYGRTEKYTNYNAFTSCLHHLEEFLVKHSIPKSASIAFPKNIGCGLAGGDWNIIESLIKEFAEKIPNNVVIVEYRK